MQLGSRVIYRKRAMSVVGRCTVGGVTLIDLRTDRGAIYRYVRSDRVAYAG